MEISSKYNPATIEEKWYQHWLNKNYFHSEPDEREPYTIVIPPPNVTGVLHMGHMLNNTIQDILIRRARMQGKNACWVPGTDHASIATEAKVVAKLASEGIQKNDLTREDFLKHAWDWTHKHGGIILEQLKKLGASCDWQRTCFTMDEARSKSVIKVFCDLYEKEKIYRGIRMVNWDPKALTAVSDEEVIHKEVNGKLYYIKYKLAEENGFAVIATTRPETIFGDVAVCINPNDPKTATFKGKKVIVPFTNRIVPIIEDDYVDVEFGTGFLKVTPAHDINDYMLGEKYKLEVLDIFNDNGTLNAHGLQYEGMDRFVVREQIEKDLATAGLLEKVEPYTNKVGFSERTDVPIEPKLSMQWFLKMKDLAQPAIDAVMNDIIKFHPNKFKNTYRHWMENIKDWNISRQLWWGHQIPAYYLPKGGFVVAETKEEAFEKAIKTVDYPITMDDLHQDEDCLDTWFSSWLWPISVFDGINNPDNKDINYYYPTNDLITAPEIIFFWVARMIMAGYEYRNEHCFQNVYFTGIVRDKFGRKMSKSLGNSPDPIALIKQYGADGVRMGMLLTSPAGNDLPFDEALCEQGRNFSNKIWNALRLVKIWNVDRSVTQQETSKKAIEWFEARFDQALITMNDHFEKYRLSDALMTVYKLVWDDFCSWYLEMIKAPMGQAIDGTTYDATIRFFENLMKILHPFMPFITEEIWHLIAERDQNDDIIIASIPEPKNSDETVLSKFDFTKEVINGIRKVRADKNIPFRDSIELFVLDKSNSIDDAFDGVIAKLCNVSNIQYVEKTPENTFGFIIGATEYFVPITENVDIEAEIEKLKEELKYTQGFLISVDKKLSNERFVNSAPADVVDKERKKKADAEARITVIEQQIKSLKN
ncbi:MAG: valine--tRNA ligase [Lentimicrobiaceae bacterium]|jgi:valyl-tRNA synthetase|nr:valine--tRNA ligase [Lentimicrobiaceae bacterium]